MSDAIDKWEIYAQEARTQLQFAKHSWSAFSKAESQTEVDVGIIFFHLQHFLNHAALIYKVLDPQPDSMRSAILAGNIDLSGLNLKPFRRLRNHLEHFDERLDDWVRQFHGHAFFDMNLITGAKGFPTRTSLRALDGHTFMFQGEEYDIDELYSTLVAIEKQLG